MTATPAYRLLGVQPSDPLPHRYGGEWTQTCVDVSVSVPTNPHDPMARIVDAHHVAWSGRVVELGGRILPGESTITRLDGTTTFELEKAVPNAVWDRAWADDTPLGFGELESEKARLLRERFQREHPEFDFSHAQVNGSVPDPETFLRDLE